MHTNRFTLRFALPMGLAAAVVAMLMTSFFISWANEREAVMEHQTADAILAAEHMARAAERGLKSAREQVGADLAVASTDPALVVIAVLDPQGQVDLAQRFSWRGQMAGAVIPGFDQARFQRAVASNLPDVATSMDDDPRHRHDPLQPAGERAGAAQHPARCDLRGIRHPARL